MSKRVLGRGLGGLIPCKDPTGPMRPPNTEFDEVGRQASVKHGFLAEFDEMLGDRDRMVVIVEKNEFGIISFRPADSVGSDEGVV